MDKSAADRLHRDALGEALRRARDGDWHGAHDVVQRHEGDAHADWIHAVLHRIEGDLANARYWYRRCARGLPDSESPQAELARIAQAIGTQPESDETNATKPRRKGKP